MLKKLLIFLMAGILAFLGYVALQPAEFHVARSIDIAATPDSVFPHINSIKKWDAWSPWAKRDPNAKMTYSGPDEGVGSVGSWSGNEDVGEGSMTIVESTAPNALKLKMAFIKPFVSTSDVGFALKADGPNKTKVTWSLQGEHGFIMRAICILIRHDVDTVMGGEYETGLANLKRVVEGE